MYKILGWDADPQCWELVACERKEDAARQTYHSVNASRAWMLLALVFVGTPQDVRLMLANSDAGPLWLNVPEFRLAALSAKEPR